MIAHKNFLFFNTYEFYHYIPKMYGELTEQFDIIAGKEKYFEVKGFILQIGMPFEDIYKIPAYKEYSFLNVDLIFPDYKAYGCIICWKKDSVGVPTFFWTTVFPQLELEGYVNKNPYLPCKSC